MPTPIWAEKLARKVQVIPNASGPQTEPRRLTRLESALAAPIVSRAPALMIKVRLGPLKRPMPMPISSRRQARSSPDVWDWATSVSRSKPTSSRPEPVRINGFAP